MAAPVADRYADDATLPRRTRGAIGLAVLLVEAALGLLLVRGLAGDVAQPPPPLPAHVTTAVTLTQDAPPRAAPSTSSRTAEGAQGASARRARATAIVAPPARIARPGPVAAPVAGTGDAAQSGAAAGGSGTGGGGSGTGPGSGGSGNGSGGLYAVSKPVKIAGELTEADYPKQGRAARLGTMVIIVLTVGEDGRASACRVHRPSGDPAADAITCRLAVERFRFRPAENQRGAPIAAEYGWQQRFFYKP